MDAIDLYEKWKTDLIRFARSIARHEQEANDLIQSALEKALKEEGLYLLPDYKQRAWFFRVMKNQLIDERRKEKRITEWEEELDFPVNTSTNHMEMVELLSHLSPEQSDIIFKKYWLGLSSKEIGEQLGVPSSTIRYKLQLGIKRLRTIIEEEF
ncbi:MAG: RNA polymerase sigma factor [Bacillus sp. (in: Bacteria)]|nr:RNA polymerase sigma factor [Bacillus sp. (in: firmicutes)]